MCLRAWEFESPLPHKALSAGFVGLAGYFPTSCFTLTIPVCLASGFASLVGGPFSGDVASFFGRHILAEDCLVTLGFVRSYSYALM